MVAEMHRFNVRFAELRPCRSSAKRTLIGLKLKEETFYELR
jgi:hypothetical protein